jgi:hypothetical protein
VVGLKELLQDSLAGARKASKQALAQATRAKDADKSIKHGDGNYWPENMCWRSVANE